MLHSVAKPLRRVLLCLRAAQSEQSRRRGVHVVLCAASPAGFRTVVTFIFNVAPCAGAAGDLAPPGRRTATQAVAANERVKDSTEKPVRVRHDTRLRAWCVRPPGCRRHAAACRCRRWHRGRWTSSAHSKRCNVRQHQMLRRQDDFLHAGRRHRCARGIRRRAPPGQTGLRAGVRHLLGLFSAPPPPTKALANPTHPDAA